MVEATPMFLRGGGLMATGCGRVAGSTGPGRVSLHGLSAIGSTTSTRDIHSNSSGCKPSQKKHFRSHYAFAPINLFTFLFSSHRPPSNSQTKRPAVLPCRSHTIHPTAHDCPSNTALYITRTLMPHHAIPSLPHPPNASHTTLTATTI